MKKFLSFACALFILDMALWAAPVNEETARKTAAGFMSDALSLRRGTQKHQTLSMAYTERLATGEAAFYAFNCGQGEGFILVSGDNRTEAVLGYADRGTFHIDSIPPAMRWWLDQYAGKIAALPATDDREDTPAGLTERTAKAEVPPLLGDIEWNQLAPYNNMCPSIPRYGRAATGCGATAMAQIMRYYQHPQQGTGTHDYNWKYSFMTQTLFADFGATTYDWGNMLPSYENGYTTHRAKLLPRSCTTAG